MAMSGWCSSRVRTRNRHADLSRPGKGFAREDAASLHYYTRPTELLPTDGIVRTTAMAATKGAKTDEQKARAIYDWVVSNAFRDPKTRGCGEGDIKTMLETGNLGGKCADLNALFVGLCRAAGLPARDVYGIRLAPSAFGYKELSGNPAPLVAQVGNVATALLDIGLIKRPPRWEQLLDASAMQRLRTSGSAP